MAKGKSSPALFEVVHGKKRFDRSASVLRTPNWWFKGRHRGPAAPAVEPAERPAFADENDPTLRGIPSPTAAPAPAAPLESEPEPEAVLAEYESALNDPTTVAVARPRRGAAFQVTIDRDRQELYLRVRYTAAIVAGFALVVVIALAYLGGRHMARGPSAALASQSSEEIAAGPIEKGVLDVGTRSGASSFASSSPGLGAGSVSAQPAPARNNEASLAPNNTATQPPRQSGPSTPAAPPKQPPPDFQNGRRIVGKQYVVIQSYAGDQQKLVEEARDYLTRNGVPCTVEKGVAGWPPAWHTVVGTQGFDRASGPQYETYREKVIAIGKDFAGKSAWKQFDPRAIRWKEAN
jgi:hypothetical protein